MKKSTFHVTTTDQVNDLESEQPQVTEPARKQRQLLNRVLRVIRKHTGIEDLDADSDGDISVMYREVPIYLIVRADPPRVQFLSPILSVVKENDPKLLARINTINAVEPRVQVFVARNNVYVKREIRIEPFQSAQISTMMMDFSCAMEGVKASLDMAFLDTKANPGIVLSRAIH